MKLTRLCLPFLAATSLAFSQTFTWTGTTDGNWNNATNWTPGLPVGSITTALVFDNAFQPTLTNNIPGGITLNSLTLGTTSPARTFIGNLLVFAGSGPTISRLNTTGNQTIQNAIRLDSSLRLTGSKTLSAQTILSGNVSGVGGIIANEGISVLSGNNSYTGPTEVRNNALLGVAGTGIASTSGVTVVAGGEMQLLQNTSTSRPIFLAGLFTGSGKMTQGLGGFIPSMAYGGTITLTGSAEIQAFGGSGAPNSASYVNFPVNGSALLSGNSLLLSTEGSGNTLSVSTISGTGSLDISPSGGEIILGNSNVNGAVSTQAGGGAVTMQQLAGIGALTVNADLAINGILSGNRNISIVSGELELKSTSNSFTGSIGIGGGLTCGSEASLGAAGNPTTFTGGTLKFISSGNLSRPITTTGGGAFTSPGFSGTISSNISGSGGFSFFNFGRNAIYTLTGTNTFQGGLGIGSGAIILFSNDTNLGAAAAPLRFSGGSLNLPAAYTTLARPIELTGGLISGSPGITHEITGNISGNGSFSLSNDSTFVLSGPSSFTGKITVSGTIGTTLVVDSDSKLGSPTATLQLGEQSGFFTRPGTLRATGNLDMAATRATTFRAATIDTNGFNVTINQPFTGRGLTKTGAGILRLNTVNTDVSNDNAINIVQGTLRLGINQPFGARANIDSMGAGAILDLNGFDAEFGFVSNVAAAAEIRLGTGTLTVRSGANIAGSINGPGSVVIGKSGFDASSSTFSGANAFSGGLTIGNGGRLTVQNPASLGAPGNAITIDDGILTSGPTLATPLVINSSTNLTIGPGGARFASGGQSFVIERQLTGTIPIRFGGGSGVFEDEIYDVRLANPANDFTGPVQVGVAMSGDSQSVIIGIVANSSLGNPANIVTLGASFFDGESTNNVSGGLRAYADVTLPSTRAIQLKGEGAVIDSNGHIFTISTPISELSPEMPLVKTGEGALILNSANTYTGETRIRKGTLGGNGSIAGDILFDSDTTLAPGAPSAIGTFACEDFRMANGGTYAVNLASGSGSDRLVVTGDAEINPGTSLLIQPTGPVIQGDVFVILQKSGTSPVSDTFQQNSPFTSGGVEWSIDYSGGDGNDITLTAMTSSAATIAAPVFSNLTITPAGSVPGSLSGISANITGGPASTSIFLEASSDLGQLDPWETIKSIPLDTNGAATITNATDPNSSGLPRNFFRLRVP